MLNRKYDFDGIIKKTRRQLGEDVATFGKRFGVSKTAIYKYEACALKAPEKIIVWCAAEQIKKAIIKHKDVFLRLAQK